jgi:hypothetical protein
MGLSLSLYGLYLDFHFPKPAPPESLVLNLVSAICLCLAASECLTATVFRFVDRDLGPEGAVWNEETLRPEARELRGSGERRSDGENIVNEEFRSR